MTTNPTPQSAKRFGDKPAIIDAVTGRTIKYSEIPLRIGTTAKALAARGVKFGDVVAIHMPNSPEYVIAFQAICSLGAIVTTSNPLYTPSELAFQLRDSNAKFAITVPALLDTMRKVCMQRDAVLRCSWK